MEGHWKLARAVFVEIVATVKRLHRSRRGSVAIMVGLALPVVVGMAALGTEITFLLIKQRQLQVVADAAAFNAAVAIQKGYPNFAVEARATAAYLGFQDATKGVTITPNSPPASGPNVNNPKAVEVIISQPQTLILAALFSNTQYNVTSRAVAMVGTAASCVLQLYAASNPGVTISGAIVNPPNCGMAVDSTGGSALSMTGAAQLNAQSVSVVGQASITNGATINPSKALSINQHNVPDPYANVAMPSIPGGCSNGTAINGKPIQYGHGSWTINQGVWCGDVSFTNDAIVSLQTGVYYVDAGTFSVGGNVKMNGTGVTIILTSRTSGNYSQVAISNGASVTLSAPTTGATQGIVFFGDRRASPSNTQSSFGGGATLNVTGAMYFPTQSVQFSNGAIVNNSDCTQLIAGKINFAGGATFQNNNCKAAGVTNIQGGAAGNSLVE